MNWNGFFLESGVAPSERDGVVLVSTSLHQSQAAQKSYNILSLTDYRQKNI